MDISKKIAQKRPSGCGPFITRKPPGPRAARASTNDTTSANPVQASSQGPNIRAPKAKPPEAKASVADPPAAEAAPSDDETKGWPAYILATTKAKLRHSLMRIHDAQLANPMDSKKFPPPVRLQRRPQPEPAAPPMSKAQALRAQEREAQLKRMAPTRAKPTISRVGKQVDVVRAEEEHPWQLTDATGEIEYLATLEGGLSHGRYAILMPDADKFRMVLLDRTYKFQRVRQPAEWAKNRPSSEISEIPAWLSKKVTADNERQAEILKNGVALKKMVTVKGNRLREVAPDANDVDYEGEFDDDEPVVLVEGNEVEEKFAQERIRREQLSANVFNSRDERKVDEEEKIAEKQKNLCKNLGKDLRKSLVEKEKNFMYESDSSCDPYQPSDDEQVTPEESSEEPPTRSGGAIPAPLQLEASPEKSAKPKPAPKRGRGKSPELDEGKLAKSKPAPKRGRGKSPELDEAKLAKSKPAPKRGRGKSPELDEAKLAKSKPAPKRGRGKSPELDEVKPTKPKPAPKRGRGKNPDPDESEPVKQKPAPKRKQESDPEPTTANKRRRRGGGPGTEGLGVEERGDDSGPSTSSTSLPLHREAAGPERPMAKKKEGSRNSEPVEVTLTNPTKKRGRASRETPEPEKPVSKKQKTTSGRPDSATPLPRHQEDGAGSEGPVDSKRRSQKPEPTKALPANPTTGKRRCPLEPPESGEPVAKKQKTNSDPPASVTTIPPPHEGATKGRAAKENQGSQGPQPAKAPPTGLTSSLQRAPRKRKTDPDPPAPKSPLPLHGEATEEPAATGQPVGPTPPVSKLITDDEIIAVVRSEPDGVTSKFITDQFRGRIMVGGQKDNVIFNAMITSLRRLTKVVATDGGLKKHKLRSSLI